MYRKRFDEHISSLSTKETRLDLASYINKDTSAVVGNDVIPDKQRRLELASHINKRTSVIPVSGAFSDKEISVRHSTDIVSTSNLGVLDSGIHRCYSALSQQTVCSIDVSPENIKTIAADSYHSLPLSMLEVSIFKNRRELVTLHPYNSFIDL